MSAFARLESLNSGKAAAKKTERTAAAPVSVAIFSSHPVMLERLQACLPRQAYEVAACQVELPFQLPDAASPIRERCAQLSRCPIWIVDVHTHRLLESVLAELPSTAEEPKLLAVGDEFPPRVALSLLLMGVRGLVRYRRLGRELPWAIRYLQAGAYWAPRRLLSQFLDELLGRVPIAQRLAPLARLSPREREVLDLVLEQLSNKEIAVRLNISERTVKFHVAGLLRKFHTGRRQDLIFRLHRQPESLPETEEPAPQDAAGFGRRFRARRFQLSLP